MWSIELVNGSEYELSVSNGIAIKGTQGAGMPPLDNVITSFGIADGALYQRTRVIPRVFTFLIDAVGSSFANLNAIRAALISASNPHRGALPVRIWYRADATPGAGLYLDAYYEAGLEGGLRNGFVEDAIALRFLAVDPYWKAETASSGSLDVYDAIPTGDAACLYRTAAGVWSSLGVDGTVDCMALSPAGVLYIGGTLYTPAYSIAQWDGDSWSALGSGLNGLPAVLIIGPDGALYVGGNFTQAGGVSRPYIAKWDGSAWSGLGSGLGGPCYALAFDSYGNLYAAGSFATAGGSAAANIAKWNGSAWSALGSGLPGAGRSIAVDSNLNIYAVGSFNSVQRWNGSAWASISALTSTDGGAVRVAPNGEVLVGADFAADSNFRRWNGVSWTAVPGSPLGQYAFISAPDDTGFYHVSGLFSDGYYPISNYRIWTGSAWVPGPLGDPGGATNSIIFNQGGVYVAGALLTPKVPGLVTVNNSGTARAFPVLQITGPGLLSYLSNYSTGQVIYFNLTLIAGEILTIDFRPGVKTVTSSFRGNLLSGVRGGSLVNFYLAPGANNIGCFVSGGAASGSYSFNPTFWAAQ